MPDLYPGASTTQRRAKSWEKPLPPIEEVRAEVLRKIELIDRPHMRAIAADPAKRAAYELLNGPQDWDKFSGGSEVLPPYRL